MEFNCNCCNSTFETSSNLQQHELTDTHLRIKAKLDLEPTENVLFRSTISNLEKENSILKKRIAELEKEVKQKQQTINTILQVVNKVAKVEIKDVEVEVKEEIKDVEEVVEK